VRLGGVGAVLFAIGLSSLTGVLQAAGMEPGCEVKVAARLAEETGAPVVLEDNDVRLLHVAPLPVAEQRHRPQDDKDGEGKLQLRRPLRQQRDARRHEAAHHPKERRGLLEKVRKKK